MPEIIVSDTSCLVLLDKIGRLDILHSVFGEIVITNIIAEEFGDILPHFIIVENPKEKKLPKNP